MEEGALIRITQRLIGPRTGLDDAENMKSIFKLPGLKIRSLGGPSRR
jgi:hypothetical protein